MLFYCCSQLSPLCLLSPPRRRCAVHCHRCRCLARPPLLPSRCRCAVHCRRRHVAVAPSIAVAVAPTITSITAAGAIVPSIAAVTVALPSLSHFPLLLPLRQPSSPLLCCHHCALHCHRHCVAVAPYIVVAVFAVASLSRLLSSITVAVAPTIAAIAVAVVFAPSIAVAVVAIMLPLRRPPP